MGSGAEVVTPLCLDCSCVYNERKCRFGNRHKDTRWRL